MKFKLKNLAALIFSGTLLAVSGCSDFLDEKDPSNLTAENYFTRPEHADAAVVAIYDNLRFLNGGTGIFAQNWQMLEALTGTSATETGQNQDLNNLLALSYNAENLFIRQWWNALYRGIANANLAIANIPAIQMDDVAKNKFLGQAQFLRALYYFWLVRLYGDVPLITKPVNATSPELYPTRATQQAVYDLIVSDLTAAENSGLAWTDNTGRVSMGAVKSLLSSVYLTMAGFPLNKGTEYYQKAADKSKEVIDSKLFRTFQNYDSLHLRGSENFREHIFMIQYAAGIIDGPFQGLMLPNFKNISAYSDEIGTTVPTVSFFNSYEATDVRKAEQQFFYTSYYDGGNGGVKVLGKPYIFKHFDKEAHGTSGVKGTAISGLNWPLIRYAEVLLTFAEAQNEISGPTTATEDAINKIRARAGLSAITGLSKDQFREAVWKERWYELCFEGKTWFDMVRTRKVFNESTKGFDNFVGHAFSYGPALQQRHLLLPLPRAEMLNNPNLTPQNDGWE
ncbi:MAG: RagB/SusD family nutrient uptake outer membrane protein [Bacteroidota bacterium]